MFGVDFLKKFVPGTLEHQVAETDKKMARLANRDLLAKIDD